MLLCLKASLVYRESTSFTPSNYVNSPAIIPSPLATVHMFQDSNRHLEL